LKKVGYGNGRIFVTLSRKDAKIKSKVFAFFMSFQLYVEDSLGDRVWVDHEDCAGFVNNILTAINSRVLPRSMLQSELVGLPGSRGESCPSPSAVVIDEEGGEGSAGSGEAGMSADIKEKIDVPIVPRQVIVLSFFLSIFMLKVSN
jgi:hypothetical protein